MIKKNLFTCALLLTVFACSENQKVAPRFLELESPAKTAGAEPNLTLTHDGRALLSWIEQKNKDVDALNFAFKTGDSWSAPEQAQTGNNWFVNWADFPSMVVFNNGTILTHWLEKSASATFSYDVKMSISSDDGASWGQPFSPHNDGTTTEHGFVSIVPFGADRALAVWLDGRNTASKNKNGAMTLRYAEITDQGKIVAEGELDSRVCDCCQTGLTVLPDGGAMVVYRDRAKGEIRDISYRIYKNKKWGPIQSIAKDGWEIAGCPVNGPAIASEDETVAIGWFTGAQDTNRVQLRISQDSGQSFGPTIRINSGEPLGRIDLVMLQDRSMLIVWMEYAEKDAAIRWTHILQDGTKKESGTLAQISAARASGFPRLVRTETEIIAAWTIAGDKPFIKTAALKIADLIAR